MSDETVWVELEVKINDPRREAILVNDGKQDTWIPRSQILDYEDDLDVGVHTKVELPVWLAAAKGLI